MRAKTCLCEYVDYLCVCVYMCKRALWVAGLDGLNRPQSNVVVATNGHVMILKSPRITMVGMTSLS